MLELELKNDDEISSTLHIVEEYRVSKSSEITKKESTEYQINIKINKVINKTRFIEWEFKDIKQKFYNIPKDEIDKFDKILKGIILQYNVDENGSIKNIENSLKTFRKIRVNTKRMVDKNLNIGMQPQDEEIIEEFSRYTLEIIYMNEMLRLVREYHKNYGLIIPINQKSYSKGHFNRKIAKEQVPSKNLIETSISDCKTKFNYSLTKKMDYNKTLAIFEKEEEDFKPLNKEKLKELFLNNGFDSKRKEELRYDIPMGIIEKYKRNSITIFGNTKTEEEFLFEFK